eukprot:3257341-Rhodomonas_salina.2
MHTKASGSCADQKTVHGGRELENLHRKPPSRAHGTRSDALDGHVGAGAEAQQRDAVLFADLNGLGVVPAVLDLADVG